MSERNHKRPGPRVSMMRRLRRFRGAEDGSATVEGVVLWIPFYLLFLFIVLDGTTIFLQNSKVQRVVQDANRQFIAGGFDNSTSDLENWIENTLDTIAPNATATAQIDANGLLRTDVAYPSSDTDLTGATAMLGNLTVRVRVVHQTEL